jgi:hypothetical protein
LRRGWTSTTGTSPADRVIFATLTENYFPDTYLQLAVPFGTLLVEIAFYVLLPVVMVAPMVGREPDRVNA